MNHVRNRLPASVTVVLSVVPARSTYIHLQVRLGPKPRASGVLCPFPNPPP